MNAFIALFYVLCALLVIAQLYTLINKIRPSSRHLGVIPKTPKEKAQYLVGLVDSGDIRKHIIMNEAILRDDNKQYESYCAFLSEKSIEAIKNMRGDSPFVTD